MDVGGQTSQGFLAFTNSLLELPVSIVPMIEHIPSSELQQRFIEDFGVGQLIHDFVTIYYKGKFDTGSRPSVMDY